MSEQVFPTKGNLIAIKKTLSLAKTGYELMDRKRNILIKEMMQLMDQVKILRKEISEVYERAYLALQRANVSMGLVSEYAKATPIEENIEISYRSVMGVDIPKVKIVNKQKEPYYGFENSDSNLDYAFECFQKVKEMTVLLAEIDNSVYRLANAIQKTQKRANALKNIVIPRYQSNVKMITSVLEEREREEFSRQKVIKNMKLKKQ